MLDQDHLGSPDDAAIPAEPLDEAIEALERLEKPDSADDILKDLWEGTLEDAKRAVEDARTDLRAALRGAISSPDGKKQLELIDFLGSVLESVAVTDERSLEYLNRSITAQMAAIQHGIRIRAIAARLDLTLRTIDRTANTILRIAALAI